MRPTSPDMAFSYFFLLTHPTFYSFPFNYPYILKDFLSPSGQCYSQNTPRYMLNISDLRSILINLLLWIISSIWIDTFQINLAWLLCIMFCTGLGKHVFTSKCFHANCFAVIFMPLIRVSREKPWWKLFKRLPYCLLSCKINYLVYFLFLSRV